MSFFSGCFISSFTGILIYFIAGYLGMDINLACALSGICGWIGPQALDAFSTSLLKIANLGSLPESVPNQRPKQED
ncbi:MAG: phage holin family protein [Eubacteriaceae bacterium]|nr:phage holin family protein [Eubacteriaceae bacterium]